jgi:4-hydroxybenzoate polyprenyltransferase
MRGSVSKVDRRSVPSSIRIRHFIRSFLSKLAHANLVLAASTAAAVYVVQIMLGLPMRHTPALILFLVTFAVYNLNRLTDTNEDQTNHPERVKFIRAHLGFLLLLSATAYVAAMILSYRKGGYVWAIALVPFVSVLAYSLPLIPTGRGRLIRIKELFLIKNLFVTTAWSATVTFLPVACSDRLPMTSSHWLFAFFCSRGFISTVTFDLRDIAGDAAQRIRSIPVVMGYERSRQLLRAINLAIAIGCLALPALHILPALSYVLVSSSLYAEAYLVRLRNSRDVRFVCDVVVDSEFAMLAIVCFAVSVANPVLNLLRHT